MGMHAHHKILTIMNLKKNSILQENEHRSHSDHD